MINKESPGAFLLQEAVQVDDLFPFLAAEEVIDKVFVPVVAHAPADRQSLLYVRQEIEEDMLMVDWLSQRLLTPLFGEWAERDGINIRDLLLALERLRTRMHLRVASLLDEGISA